MLSSPTRRMNVAIVPEWYPSPIQPVSGTFVRDQARAVAPHADVTVVYRDPDLAPARGLWSIDEERDDGFGVLRIATRRLGPLTPLPRVLATRAALRRLSRAGRAPDVLHAHVFPAAVAALLARRRGTPVVVTEHYSGVRRGTLSRWERFLARLAYTRAALTCPVSRDLGGAIAALAPGARIRQVPNSVDMALFAPPAGGRDADGSAPRLLVVAMLSPVKAVTNLLQALPAVAARWPGVSLDVVGDGPERGTLEREAAALGLDAAVAFHGRLAKPAVAERMRAADLLVLPSLTENLPCVVIEALATGLPVVATRVGGLPELVPPERGVLVEPGDVAGLAAGIAAALERPGGWDQDELSRDVRERYSLETTGREWLDVYRGLAAGSPTGA
jgi:glycosyltransferase involved in cell wall biosynthesis